MNRIKTFVLAASILTLALGAFPHHALASAATPQAPPSSPACSKGTHIKGVAIEVVLSLLSLL